MLSSLAFYSQRFREPIMPWACVANPLQQLGLALFIVLFCHASTSSTPINSTYTISYSDYELQNNITEIIASPNATFQLKFGNLPGQSNPHSLGIIHAASSTLLWCTFRNGTIPGQYDNLGGTSTSLQLREDGDLVITIESGGSDELIWSTSTANMDVQSMELQENGNLVLLNSSGGVVWQSFDHPTDTIISNQKLLVGKSLLVGARNGFPSVGQNLLSMEAYRLVSYVLYDDSEPYWELSAPDNGTELAYAAIANNSISVFDKDDELVASKGNLSISSTNGNSLKRFSIASDGNMRLYEYDNSTSAWVQQMQVIVDACTLPDDCGSYGVCVPGQGCTCPSSFNLLVTLNGCVPRSSFVCNSKHGNDFVKVSAASYFAANISSAAITGLSLKGCQNLCTNNCSCLGFFYGETGLAAGKCLITNQMRTIMASVYGNYSDAYAYDAYVRVQGKPRSPLAIILGVCIPVVVIIFCVLLWWFVRQRVKVAHAEEEEFLLSALPGLPPRYSYKELKNATDNFTHRMGGGSFGSVYEGVLSDGTKIAVKRLEGVVQGKKEFHAEVATIGTVRHLNLVRLRGFCLEKQHRLVVYEHMGKGALDGLVFMKSHSSKSEKLRWDERLLIAIGVAKGLAYLHEGSPECIIHCDIKPENILVGEDGVAKLSDFGLAKLMNRQRAFVETNVRGTRGYMAPEWVFGRRQITEKADVYSYGVVLLELLSGRRNFEGPEEGSLRYLPEWARQNLTDDNMRKAEEILDPSIGDADEAEKRRAVLVALWCLQEDPEMRPAMSRVVRMLEGDVEVPPPPLPPPSSANSTVSTIFPMAVETDRFATSEVTLPFLKRASHYLFSSTTSSAPTVASSL